MEPLPAGGRPRPWGRVIRNGLDGAKEARMTVDMNALQVRFTNSGPFYVELKRRVRDYFDRTHGSPRDDPRLYLKTGVLLTWLGGSYALLLFAAAAWWQAAFLAVSAGFAVASIAFNIQHDANHGAYSRSRVANRALGAVMDLLGGSSYVWRWKHNVFHHTYPNIPGLDADIDQAPFSRLAPAQPRRPVHRYQHLYLWPLYGLLAFKWHFVDDFRDLATGHIGGQKFRRPGPWGLLWFLCGKAFFFTGAIVVPAMLHPLWAVLLLYGVAFYVASFVLAVTFQLSHCVCEADFLPTGEGARRKEIDWAVHQVQSTVDFARESRFLSWYLGGLNFQIEHHLFPRVCHVHYPALSRIVEATCREFGVRYRTNPTLRAALASHVRWLRQLGRPAEISIDG